MEMCSAMNAGAPGQDYVQNEIKEKIRKAFPGLDSDFKIKQRFEGGILSKHKQQVGYEVTVIGIENLDEVRKLLDLFPTAKGKLYSTLLRDALISIKLELDNDGS
ncbi:MAG: hypothetical protein ACYCQJ_10135 [Nitrososphaerales archaeon]